MLTGRKPDAPASAVLNATLVAIAEHGMVPSVQAARMTLAAAPDAMQGAVAAGILGSGSVIHGMHHEQDMRKMGSLRKYMPITFITMAMGWLAICGIPIWAGFFSKDEILYRTFAASSASVGEATIWGIHANTILWVVGLITAVLTAVYMTRLMIMTFFGEERFHGSD